MVKSWLRNCKHCTHCTNLAQGSWLSHDSGTVQNAPTLRWLEVSQCLSAQSHWNMLSIILLLFYCKTLIDFPDNSRIWKIRVDQSPPGQSSWIFCFTGLVRSQHIGMRHEPRQRNVWASWNWILINQTDNLYSVVWPHSLLNLLLQQPENVL